MFCNQQRKFNAIFSSRYRMPSGGPAFSHQEFRGRLCCCCGVKLSKYKAISATDEALVKQYGPSPSYDSSVPNYPTGLCSSCQCCPYKIRSKQPVKSWDGPQPPSWSMFNIDTIFGARTCGTLGLNGELQKCDICSHVRSNPIGSSLP